MPRLVIEENGQRRVLTLARDVTTMGRAPSNTLPLLDIRASRRHCRIEKVGEGWRLVDLGSQNGTQVNGVLVDRRDLRPGDVISIGGTRIRFDDGDGEPLPDPLRETVTGLRLDLASDDDDLPRLRREKDNLLRLQRVTHGMSSELDLPRLLRLIVDHAVDITEAERGFLILVQDGKLSFEVARNYEQGDVEEPEYTVSHSIARKVLESGERVMSVNAAEDERFAGVHSIETIGLRAVLCMPLRSRAGVVGILYLDNRLQQSRFDEDRLRMLDAMAGQAAVAIENARLVNELRDKTVMLEEANREIAGLNEQLESRVEAQGVEIRRINQELKRRQAQFEHKYSYSEIIGRSAAMQKVFALLDRVTDAEYPVLIQGESGTGKVLIARAVHVTGPRRRQPFVSENCAAITETLLESELFGYVRGAFTGADRNRKGLFEQAHQGTLFLDEVGETSLEMQKKLLRVLQEGEVRRVGGKESIQVDVRIISASNRDLRRLVEEKKFREDLFYRLNVLSVDLPPLRDRREDIPLLVEHFLKEAAKGDSNVPRRIDPRVLDVLTAYDWPGNVRELENEVHRMCALADDVVTEAVLSETVRGGHREPPTMVGSDGIESLSDLVERVETSEILRALRASDGNKTRAAQMLGISRFTLQRKLDKYSIEAEDD